MQKQEEDEQPREETSPLPPTFSNTSPAIRSISVANKLTKWEYQKKREVEEYLEEKKSSSLCVNVDPPPNQRMNKKITGANEARQGGNRERWLKCLSKYPSTRKEEWESNKASKQCHQFGHSP